MEGFDGRFLNRADHAFGLSIGPRVIWLGRPVLDAIAATETEEEHYERHVDKGPTPVSHHVWMVLDTANQFARCDWLTGEFSFARHAENGPQEAFGFVMGVEVDRTNLPLVGSILDSPDTNIAIKNVERLSSAQERRGRPRKWDWEGAICAVLAEAQRNPDGLPTGYGAQTQVGNMIRQWFLDNQDGEPATSEIGQRAAKIMQAIESHRN